MNEIFKNVLGFSSVEDAKEGEIKDKEYLVHYLNLFKDLKDMNAVYIFTEMCLELEEKRLKESNFQNKLIDLMMSLDDKTRNNKDISSMLGVVISQIKEFNKTSNYNKNMSLLKSFSETIYEAYIEKDLGNKDVNNFIEEIITSFNNYYILLNIKYFVDNVLSAKNKSKGGNF